MHGPSTTSHSSSVFHGLRELTFHLLLTGSTFSPVTASNKHRSEGPKAGDQEAEGLSSNLASVTHCLWHFRQVTFFLGTSGPSSVN